MIAGYRTDSSAAAEVVRDIEAVDDPASRMCQSDTAIPSAWTYAATGRR